MPSWWERAVPLVCGPDGATARASAWVLIAPLAYWLLFFLAVGTALSGLSLRRPRPLWLGVGALAGAAAPAWLSLGPFILLGALVIAAAGWRNARPARSDVLAALVAALLLPAVVLGLPIAMRAYYCAGAGR